MVEVSNHKLDTKSSHLLFLDGIRGIAALYVVWHHASMEMLWKNRHLALSTPLRWLMNGCMPGHLGVSVFIVLSGFCLMLPVAATADGAIKGGTVAYIKRRARRILPPYYAALLLTFVFLYAVPGLSYPSGILARTAMPEGAALRPALLSHLFLVHNVDYVWAYRFNGPMWSVATEWQIYFLMPLVLLPVWRKAGLAATAAVGVILGLLPHFLLHGASDCAKPWMIGLFAMGMVGASICFSGRKEDARLLAKVPWSGATLLGVILIAVMEAREIKMVYTDLVAGPTVMCLLIWCASKSSDPDGNAGWLLKLLEHPTTVKLGAISYSLYLTHVLVVEFVNYAALKIGVSPNLQLPLMLVADTVLALLLALLFHLSIERRFMSAHMRATTQAK